MSESRDFAACKVTLDGKPAIITGANQPFAHVVQLGSGLSCEWAWETVELIVAKGGDFKS